VRTCRRSCRLWRRPTAPRDGTWGPETWDLPAGIPPASREASQRQFSFAPTSYLPKTPWSSSSCICPKCRRLRRRCQTSKWISELVFLLACAFRAPHNSGMILGLPPPVEYYCQGCGKHVPRYALTRVRWRGDWKRTWFVCRDCLPRMLREGWRVCFGFNYELPPRSPPSPARSEQPPSALAPRSQ